jgi:hypothetical protein
MHWGINASLADEKIVVDNRHIVFGHLHICGMVTKSAIDSAADLVLPNYA